MQGSKASQAKVSLKAAPWRATANAANAARVTATAVTVVNAQASHAKSARMWTQKLHRKPSSAQRLPPQPTVKTARHHAHILSNAPSKRLHRKLQRLPLLKTQQPHSLCLRHKWLRLCQRYPHLRRL